MPSIGPYHPIIVHFVVVPLILGLPIYLLGLVLKRPRYFWPMASILLVVGTVSTWLATQSGSEAHELAERIPGVAQAVRIHQELGEDTRDIFTGILIVELLAIGAAWRTGQLGDGATGGGDGGSADRAGAEGDGAEREAATSRIRRLPFALRVVVAASWIWGAWMVYDTAHHGGDLVYSYAGGVGVRTGNPQDVRHLLMAGLFNQSLQDRKDGDHADAARLVNVMVTEFPNDPEVELLKAESLILDLKDGRGALALLATLPTSGSPRLRIRKALYESDAYALLSMPDSARAALETLPARFQRSRMVKDRLAKLGGG